MISGSAGVCGAVASLKACNPEERAQRHATLKQQATLESLYSKAIARSMSHVHPMKIIESIAAHRHRDHICASRTVAAAEAPHNGHCCYASRRQASITSSAAG